MATAIILEDELEIPFVRSLAEFRVWAMSDNFPSAGRIDYVALACQCSSRSSLVRGDVVKAVERCPY